MFKQYEIHILDELEKKYKSCPESYLHDYFTGNNIQWLRNHILNDFIPYTSCQMDLIIQEQKAEINRLEDKIIAQDTVIKDLKKILKEIAKGGMI